MRNLTGTQWRKSTRSSNQGNCVEVADNLAGAIGVRDSKDPAGPVLTFTSVAWTEFIYSARTGHIR